MVYITCQVFTKKGIWYTTEKVYIEDGTSDYNIPDQIYQNRNIEDMIYIGKTIEYDTLFLVNAI
jgi:hypothetical protein